MRHEVGDVRAEDADEDRYDVMEPLKVFITWLVLRECIEYHQQILLLLFSPITPNTYIYS